MNPTGRRYIALTRKCLPRLSTRIRCVSGKRGYGDQQTANQVLGRIWAKPKPGRQLECRTYRCPQCDQWHLTSMPLARGA